MKKVLQVASVASIIEQFDMANVELLLDMGCEVAVAANFDFGNNTSDEAVARFRRRLGAMGVKVFHIPFYRNAMHPGNIRAYKKFAAIPGLADYDVVHCHSPIGGVIARLAMRKFRHKGCRVAYTAHGFHFYQGAPLANWIMFYPVEKLLMRLTDVLITINHEDFAQGKRLAAGTKAKVFHIPGVGIDNDKFAPLSAVEKAERRRQLGFGADEFLLIYGAEFNQNKNQQFFIRAMKEIVGKIPAARLLLVGHGKLLQQSKELIKSLGLEDKVCVPGFRDDMPSLIPACDLGISASRREGLPVALAECVACGLPIIASVNRGHLEVVTADYNGYLFDPDNSTEFINAVIKLHHDATLRAKMSQNSRLKSADFALGTVNNLMRLIYTRLLK